jgi:hypothetical protein
MMTRFVNHFLFFQHDHCYIDLFDSKDSVLSAHTNIKKNKSIFNMLNNNKI